MHSYLLVKPRWQYLYKLEPAHIESHDLHAMANVNICALDKTP